LKWHLFFVCLGIFLDFFDGFLHGCSTFRVLGLQLDSLRYVTSGVVPGLVMFQMMIDHSSAVVSICNGFLIWVLIGFLLPLSNFNIDVKPTFIGLPTYKCLVYFAFGVKIY
jgi:CDP-diacylglycerol--serine O-phosphatidyltransferase